MFRVTGAIPTIKRSAFPEHILIFDTESYKGIVNDGVEYQSLRLGVAKYIRLGKDTKAKEIRDYNFSNVGQLFSIVDECLDSCKTLYIYAHNLKYDLQLSGLYQTLIAEDWEIETIVIEDPPTFIKCSKDGKSIWLVDTFNYWQFSLAKMGEQLGLDKLNMPDWNDNDENWFTYCKRDVDVLAEYLLSFITFLYDNDLAPLGLTVASQAFRAYRHRFMNTEIIIHNREDVLQLERDAYSGGRVECFYIGELSGEKFYKLDVNSMYPYVMSEHRYPVELVGHTDNISVEKLKELMEKYYVIAKVQIETTENYLPYKNSGKLIFPIGLYDATLHHSELLYTTLYHRVHKVYTVAIYKLSDIFKRYVSFFHAIKETATKEANPVDRQLSKIFLNSLYGKFGQRGYHTEVIDNEGLEKYERITGYSERLARNVTVMYLGNRQELRWQDGESTYSFPAISGAVTAYARMYLHSLIVKAGKENVFYCDTDSIFCNETGYQNLSSEIKQGQLGKLAVEDVSNKLTIYGAKDYIFGDTVKHKGVPKRHVEIAKDTYEYSQFIGAKTWANNGFTTGVEIYTRIKRRISSYDKGIVDPLGFVTPIRFV